MAKQILMENFQTLPELLLETVNLRDRPNHFNFLQNGQWQPISTKDFHKTTSYLSQGLMDLNLTPGSGIGLISDSSPHWLMIDLAIMISGNVTVPMFANVSTENLNFQIKDADLGILFIAGQDNWDKLGENRKKFKKLITLNIQAKEENSISFEDFITAIKGDFDQERFQKNLNSVQPNHLATIIYTSGSTGIPKGVELSQENLSIQVKGAISRFPIYASDNIVSCLPLAHIFERMVMYFFVTTGAAIYFVDDVKNLGPILREVRPHMMTVVPRLLEKVHAKIKENTAAATGFKKILGSQALKRATSKNPASLKTPWDFILDRLVYKKFRAAVGGRCRYFVAGGAALNKGLNQFYENIGIKVYQGYGLTEAAPVIATNHPKGNKIGTVGPTFPNVEVKLAPDGELLARGPNIMQGYHNNPQATAEVIDEDGWLHTGDLATIDDAGFVSISGRKKELLKTSTGKYVSPIPTEQAIANLDLIDHCMVVADGRKCVSCLLFPDFENVEKLKASRAMDNLSDQDFFNASNIQKEIQAHIDLVNKNLAQWEQVVSWGLVLQKISIESGELTPKMNFRRHILEEKFKRNIEDMYKD